MKTLYIMVDQVVDFWPQT